MKTAVLVTALALMTGVPLCAMAAGVSNSTADHATNVPKDQSHRLTWSEIETTIPPIQGLLPNGLSENGYN